MPSIVDVGQWVAIYVARGQFTENTLLVNQPVAVMHTLGIKLDVVRVLLLHGV